MQGLAINALVEQMCDEQGVGLIDLWGYFVGKEDVYMRDGLHLSRKQAAVFCENLLRSVDRFAGGRSHREAKYWRHR